MKKFKMQKQSIEFIALRKSLVNCCLNSKKIHQKMASFFHNSVPRLTSFMTIEMIAFYPTYIIVTAL